MKGPSCKLSKVHDKGSSTKDPPKTRVLQNYRCPLDADPVWDTLRFLQASTVLLKAYSRRCHPGQGRDGFIKSKSQNLESSLAYEPWSKLLKGAFEKVKEPEYGPQLVGLQSQERPLRGSPIFGNRHRGIV